MNAYTCMVLQNALLVGAVFATYWLSESWWAWLWLLLWLQPSESKEEEDEEDQEPQRVIVVADESRSGMTRR